MRPARSPGWLRVGAKPNPRLCPLPRPQLPRHRWPQRQEFDVSRTKTQTVVRTRAEFDLALRQVQLTAQEENVLRMRYGVPLAADALLQFRDPEPEAQRAELIDLERRAVHAMDNRVDSQRLTSIIDRMRRL